MCPELTIFLPYSNNDSFLHIQFVLIVTVSLLKTPNLCIGSDCLCPLHFFYILLLLDRSLPLLYLKRSQKNRWMKKVSYRNEISHSQTKTSWIFGWKRKSMWYFLCQGRIVCLTLFLSSLLPEKRIHIQVLALYQCWYIELDDNFTWRFHFFNWSYFQTNLFFPPVCLGPSWQPYALDMVSKLWLPSRHFQITLFLCPNPKTIEIITMAVFFATQSNFSPSLLLPSFQMGWHCYQISLLAPFHWILIRRKEDLSFCLQGYQINMNIGSSDRLGTRPNWAR